MGRFVANSRRGKMKTILALALAALAAAEPEAKPEADAYYGYGYGLGGYYGGYRTYGLGYSHGLYYAPVVSSYAQVSPSASLSTVGIAPAAIPAVGGAYAGAGRYVANSTGTVHVAKREAEADPYYYGGYHGLGYRTYGYGLGHGYGYGYGHGYGYYG